MSYDGYIYLPVAPKTEAADAVDAWDDMDPWEFDEILLFEIGNYTSNVARMWSLALEHSGHDDIPHREPDDYITLSGTDRWTCERAAPLLTKAAAWLAEHRAEMEELNPDNGWGDYEGALTYLTRAARMSMLLAGVRSGHGQAYLRWSH